jgi:uncharacterized RDD family membrane protein YckC
MTDYQQQPAEYQQPAYGGGTGPSGPRSGFWIRFGAVFIDGLIIQIPVFAVALGLGFNANARSGLSFVIGVLYFGFFEGSSAGQTPGKKVCGIRVIDFNGGGSIGYGRAVIRNIVSIISGLVIALGYLWMLWDREKQTWHDKVSSSVVVPVAAYPPERWP